MKSKFKRTVLISLLLCMLFSLTAYAEPVRSGTGIEVVQNFRVQDGKQPHAGDRFDYVFESAEAGNPMPPGTDADGVYRFHINGSAKELIPLNFEHAGIYRYRLRTDFENKAQNYSYDQRSYEIEVYVTNAPDNCLEVTVLAYNKEVKCPGIVYNHSYQVPSGKPKTGDESSIMLYALLAGLSACGAAAILTAKKKEY